MAVITSRSDEEVFADMAAGSSAALGELYLRHAKDIYVFCARMVQADMAVDLVHDTFMRAVSSSESFDRARGSVRGWMFSIARNLCIDRLRSRSQKSEAYCDEAVGGPAGSEAATLRDEAFRAVRDCVGALERNHLREALLLYHLGGRVYREIGAILGRSTSQARNIVQEAMQSVRHCLESKGIDFVA